MTVHVSHLTPELAEAVHGLAERAREADGISPFNETARRAIAHPSASEPRFAHLTCNDLAGYAQIDLRDRSVQLVVDPDRRRQGVGSQLVRVIRESYDPRLWWAFGNLPEAQGLAERFGLRPVRGLSIMRFDGEATPSPMPEGYRLDSLGADEHEQFVALNAAAFARHPEQGQMTLDEVQERLGDHADVLVARDDTGALAGFHWTKVEDGVGEVYVIGVHPDHERRGLGRALLAAGLGHMAQQGANHVILYVEADARRVIEIYRNAGFHTVSTDMAYAERMPHD